MELTPLSNTHTGDNRNDRFIFIFRLYKPQPRASRDYPKKYENQNKKPFGERFNRATIEKAVRLYNDTRDSMTPSQRKAAKDILYRKAYNSARRGTLTLKRRRYLKMVGIDIPASNRTRRPRRVRKEEKVLNGVRNP